MEDANYRQAGYTADNRAIVNSDGEVIQFNDPRVVHVWAIEHPTYFTKLLARFYESRGLRFRVCAPTDQTILQYGKRVCTGRECMPINAIAGAIVKDLDENRAKGEVALYHCYDQIGPCQNAEWTVIFDVYAKRKRIRDAIFMAQISRITNYFGQGIGLAKDYVIAYVLSDVFEEAENSLRCLAEDRHAALTLFMAETCKFVASLDKRSGNVSQALSRWAGAVREIPLKRSLKNAPKLLLFGGLNTLMAHQPVTDYLYEQDVIVKIVDITDGIIWGKSDGLLRASLRNGVSAPDKQYSTRNLVSSLLGLLLEALGRPLSRSDGGSDGVRAIVKSLLVIRHFESVIGRMRRIAEKSALLFDGHVHFRDLATIGHQFVSNSSVTETSIIVGRYAASLASGTYDGMLNVSCFNCQPGQNAIAITRSLANHSNVPYASIEYDGSGLTTNQIRVLENLVVQAIRRREEHAKGT